VISDAISDVISDAISDVWFDVLCLCVTIYHAAHTPENKL
jgi:hypothetical protein